MSASPKAAMNPPVVRGACPRLSAPMQTGDGLLARLVPAGPMAIDAFVELCAAAHTHGNGVMEISARGSLQVRGLSPKSAPLFATEVEALDLDICGDVPVIASPLPHDPSALIDAHALAADLREAVAASGLIVAPKLSVVVDGGGQLHLDALTADIRLRAVSTPDGPKLLVSLAGVANSATALGMVAPHDASRLVRDLLSVIAAHGPDARASHIDISEFREVAKIRLAPATSATRTQAETIGLHRLSNDACAIGVALEFGQAHANDLMALAGIAAANGATWVASAPNRTLLLGPIDEMTGFVLATAADSLGFVVDARDSRRRVVACPGAPSCASGLIAARALAAEIADALPASQTGIAVHVSGCAKGCAHPMSAPLTIVGTEQGCGIVHDGTARARPERHIEASNLVAEISKMREPVNA